MTNFATRRKRELLAELSRELDRADLELEAAGSSVEEIARRMIAVIPHKHEYDEQVGPFFDVAGVQALLQIGSRQAVHDRVSRGTLLQVKTSDGRVLFPVFQFIGRSVDKSVIAVVQVLRRTGADGWTIAHWLTTPAAALDGETPAGWIHTNPADSMAVVRLSEDTAARWAA